MTWDAKKEHAVELIAAGELTFEKIAATVDIAYSTLWLWRKEPEFAARVDARIEEINASLRKLAITHPERRIASLNARHQRLTRILSGRSDDDLRGTDVPLLKELREIEKQAAQELGQWTNRADVTTNGESLLINLVEVVQPPDADDEDEHDP